ncbi:MAG TPA: hypothetical protein VEN47_03970 [Myxococcota bacterium]|nr:hypothetical protein [Myxococcota bacterium]
MRRLVALIAAVALCADSAGCSAAPERTNDFQMAPRLEYDGFSFGRPPGASSC